MSDAFGKGRREQRELRGPALLASVVLSFGDFRKVVDLYLDRVRVFEGVSFSFAESLRDECFKCCGTLDDGSCFMAHRSPENDAFALLVRDCLPDLMLLLLVEGRSRGVLLERILDPEPQGEAAPGLN
jgi:hypothetical protein